ncbi:isopenicillin N synthase family dioxygenase [Actinomadura atramentaria]|uniref:isopenicillin N synthase family dioxygenase n=1 Tax=Actinomadura atramentaria TaxID=1990 RepID=UPI000379A16F|nr:2OG-Fe(II) oxygenase family protein [Actinomadura atramentaria]
MPYELTELHRESRMGGRGTETDRPVPRVDLTDFAACRAEITDELWAAATGIGFFQVTGHGIDPAAVRAAFAEAERFFALPDETKARHALKKGANAGWESLTQVRPSVGTPDRKESYQVTRPHMAGLWPDEEFRATLLDFEARCRDLAMRLLSCFATRLGFDDDFFARAHDPSSPRYRSTLRLLHYYALPPGDLAPDVWRAGAHTDFDCLTLLFQRAGQGGLQVCPGAEMDEQEWTSVEPSEEAITCNIGDMLMRWSGDRLRSNFHRVTGDHRGDRYSIAFFAQADGDVVIESPAYPPITADEYLRQRIEANYG